MDFTEQILNDEVLDEDLEAAGENSENEGEAISEVDAESTSSDSEVSQAETKAEKFLRLAPPRIDKIIKGIKSLKKLSAHGSYEYTKEQTDKMFAAIREELEACEKSFEPNDTSSTGGFTF